jgi:hypothetical protein
MVASVAPTWSTRPPLATRSSARWLARYHEEVDAVTLVEITELG